MPRIRTAEQIERHKQVMREYYLRNREQILEYNKAYIRENKEIVYKKQAEYQRRKRAEFREQSQNVIDAF